MQIKKVVSKTAAALLSAALAGLFTAARYYSQLLPDEMTARSGEKAVIAEYPEISLCSGTPDCFFISDSNGKATLSLFGAFPVKSVAVREAEAPALIVGGQPFGIKLLMDGVIVTGLGNVENSSGKAVCPAADAGIEEGDIVHTADGKKLTSNLQLHAIISKSKGEPISLSIERSGEMFETLLTPVFSEKSGQWKCGMWVRDSIAGIGTMTFIDPSSGKFAGLGHPICDSDTGGIVPLQSGEAVPVEITDAKKGEKGIPGELRGRFSMKGSLGSLELNNSCGVFGELSDDALEQIASGGDIYPLGYRQDISTGTAEIYTTIEGEKPQKYAVEIEKIDYSASDSTKNMLIRITDERLLEEVGGIVQGMSGSPIIQNGRLIGAVTHVFVNDPTCGFAVFAENMACHIDEMDE